MQLRPSIVLLTVVPFLAMASDVLEFKDDDWADSIKEHDIVLVEFFAPWCGHCKRLAPEFEKAATKLKLEDPPVSLAKVDCTESKTTCDKFGVTGFPTLKIFRNGELSSDYSGPREADGIVKFMRGQSGASSKELKSLADFDKFVDNDEHSVIGFFEKETKLKSSFMKVADTHRERYRFAHTSNPDILKKYEITDDMAIFQPTKLQTKFEDPILKYSGSTDTDKINKFLSGDIQGLCGHRTMDTAMSFERPLVVAYYNVDYVKDPKGSNYWRNRVLKVAKKFQEAGTKVKFAISNKDAFGHEMEENGLGERKDETKPVVVGLSEEGKFPMAMEFSMDALEEFVKSFLSGKVPAYMKSEPVPDNSGNAVKVVVAKNFKDIVDQDKDVLLEFYAPWCGHCKKLAPIWDDLAEKMAKEKDIVIAKMDATANDVPPKYQVQGFPTLYWVPKGKKDTPETYSGGRELDDFVKFLAKRSTSPLAGYSRDAKKSKKAKKEL